MPEFSIYCTLSTRGTSAVLELVVKISVRNKDAGRTPKGDISMIRYDNFM